MGRKAGVNILRHLEWSDFIDRADKGFAEYGVRSGWGTDKWAGGSWAGARKMATGEGYKAAVVEAESLASQVENTITAELFQNTFESTWQVSGAEVDMGRFLAGEPECMIESQPIRISRQGRAVRIVVNVCYSAFVEEQTVRQRGAAVLALVDILSRAQHPLEIWACVPILGDDQSRLTYMVKVQEAAAPLDIGRVMFALAHPTMLRRLVFSAADHEDESIHETFGIGSGYGHACEICDSDLPDQVGNTIKLGSLHGSADWSAPAAIKWVEDQLTEIFRDA